MKFHIAKSVANHWSILLAQLKKSTMQNAQPARLLRILLPPATKPASPSHGIRLGKHSGGPIRTRKLCRTNPVLRRFCPLLPRETGELVSYKQSLRQNNLKHAIVSNLRGEIRGHSTLYELFGIYLLGLGLPKALYAGTTHIFFTLGNAIKAVPWLLVGRTSSEVWWLMAVALPVVPVGVWLGWKLHESLDQTQLYRLCYGLLVVTGLKLLWDGVLGYVA